MFFIRRHPVLTISLLLVLVIGAWVGVEVHAALTAKPAPDTDYGAQMRALMLRAQLAEDKPAPAEDELAEAWAAYERVLTDVVGDAQLLADEAIESVGWPDAGVRGYEDWSPVFDPDEWRAGLRAGETPDGLTPEQALAEFEAVSAAQVAAVRSDAAGAVLGALLDRARSGSPLVRPWPSDEMLIHVVLPELGWMRRATLFCRAVMADAAEREDWDTYREALEVSLWLSETAANEPILIGYLVGVGVQTLVFEQLRSDLIHRRLPGNEIGRVGELLRARPMVGMQHALQGERLWSLDAVQRTHDSRGRLLLSETTGLGAPFGAGVGGARIANVASIVMPRRHETETRFNSFYDRLIDIDHLPTEEARLAIAAYDREIDALSGREQLLNIMLPAVASAYRTEWRHRLARGGLLTVLAIERHRAAAGSPPDSLDGLVPVYLDALPEDPFASDGRLIYRTDGSTLGYTLYSVGFDGQDNGGKFSENVFKALHEGATGTDFVFTRPE